MRASVITVILLATFGWAGVRAADNPVSVGLPPATGEKGGAARFDEAQLAYVQSWIRQKAPECPAGLTAAVAEGFLGELRERPGNQLDRLLQADFPLPEYESRLLRQVGAKLAGPAQAALRETIAQRRIQVVLAAENKTAAASPKEAADLLAKIRDVSQVYHRRLLEGRLDDDDLALLLKKARQTGVGQKEAAPAKPKVLTAADIVAEFSRHNQVGAALQRLQAYVVEGRLKTSAGEEQQLQLFKMRPDRFRLVVRSGGLTRYILASDGAHFWQQAPGQPPQFLKSPAIGARRYLGEFSDPLFATEGNSYERLADGVAVERKVHRIAVRRPDGSNYVACIDAENFREVARENEDKSRVHYSDFRDVAGLTIAFREEATDLAGHSSVLELTRVTPNPGLIQAFFEAPAQSRPDYFEIERLLAQAGPAPGKVN